LEGVIIFKATSLKPRKKRSDADSKRGTLWGARGEICEGEHDFFARLFFFSSFFFFQSRPIESKILLTFLLEARDDFTQNPALHSILMSSNSEKGQHERIKERQRRRNFWLTG